MKLDELSLFRQEIDNCDRDLIRAFCRRMELSSQLAGFKQDLGLPVRDEAREQELLEGIALQAGPEYAGESRILYETILALSRARQQRLRAAASQLAEGESL